MAISSHKRVKRERGVETAISFYHYHFTRPCGHMQSSYKPWFDRAEAERHEEWAKAHTLCSECIEQEQVRIHGPRRLREEES